MPTTRDDDHERAAAVSNITNVMERAGGGQT